MNWCVCVPNQTPLGKRKADAEADGVEITPPTKVPLQAAGDDDLDDELQYIGRTGKNALQCNFRWRGGCQKRKFMTFAGDKGTDHRAEGARAEA